MEDGTQFSFHILAAELKRYQGTSVMYNFIDMYTPERIKENTGCCVTRTDDTRQEWDTPGIRYIGFAREHHLLLMVERRNGYVLSQCKNSGLFSCVIPKATVTSFAGFCLADFLQNVIFYSS
ncbi:hypothetical protein AVEN_116663-1 [Araneus ventricosus]|uniref:Uncharacterized protein n=1 Tax=Araneus ventricosus TaxID=182803 RepID=A0A4Y2JN38_ARAVE|nr:hypothetical protein AVEN_116663-1 [Araneus ventricosus]